MPTQYPELFAALAAPFVNGEVKQRSQGGRTFSYISARATMNRLDEVLGPENWTDECQRTDKGAICVLTITLPDGKTVSKTGLGGEAGMADEGDNEMSAESTAFKRAGVKLGIGRYLYRDGVPNFAAALHPQTNSNAPPARQQQQHQGTREADDTGNQAAQKPAIHQRPKGGSGYVFIWCRDIGVYYGIDLLSVVKKYVDQQSGWSKEWKNWTAEQTADVLLRTARYCSKLPNYAGELDDILGKSEQEKT